MTRLPLVALFLFIIFPNLMARPIGLEKYALPSEGESYVPISLEWSGRYPPTVVPESGQCGIKNPVLSAMAIPQTAEQNDNSKSHFDSENDVREAGQGPISAPDIASAYDRLLEEHRNELVLMDESIEGPIDISSSIKDRYLIHATVKMVHFDLHCGDDQLLDTYVRHESVLERYTILSEMKQSTQTNGHVEGTSNSRKYAVEFDRMLTADEDLNTPAGFSQWHVLDTDADGKNEVIAELTVQWADRSELVPLLINWPDRTGTAEWTSFPSPENTQNIQFHDHVPASSEAVDLSTFGGGLWRWFPILSGDLDGDDLIEYGLISKVWEDQVFWNAKFRYRIELYNWKDSKWVKKSIFPDPDTRTKGGATDKEQLRTKLTNTTVTKVRSGTENYLSIVNEHLWNLGFKHMSESLDGSVLLQEPAVSAGYPLRSNASIYRTRATLDHSLQTFLRPS